MILELTQPKPPGKGNTGSEAEVEQVAYWTSCVSSHIHACPREVHLRCSTISGTLMQASEMDRSTLKP